MYHRRAARVKVLLIVGMEFSNCCEVNFGIKISFHNEIKIIMIERKKIIVLIILILSLSLKLHKLNKRFIVEIFSSHVHYLEIKFKYLRQILTHRHVYF